MDSQRSSYELSPRHSARSVPTIGVFLLAAVRVAAAGDAAVDVRVLESAPDRVVLEVLVRDFDIEPVLIDGAPYVGLKLGKESPIKVAGSPELPNVCRSIVISDDARFTAHVLASEHYDVEDIDVAPSKGFIFRHTNPEDVPYTFGDAYDEDAFYPGPLAELRDPYILRDLRGIVVEVNPFQYNPVQRLLRVYTQVTVEVVADGPGEVNVLRRPATPREPSLAFHHLYERHFLNFPSGARYVPLDETGDMLIIAHDAWLANVQPLVNHKNARGISTTAVGVSTIGNTPAAIKAYIQGLFDSGDLAFVLLVGDAAQVASPQVTVQYETESADPTYALLAGADNYPDLLVGRFSAESAAQVDTQVLRSIAYETGAPSGEDWFWRGTGVASNEGPGDDGEFDYQHLDNIRTDLLSYGYTQVDRIYDPGATAAQVSAALNAGRGIVNYTGHGSPTSWGTTGFSVSHVNALTNVGMLPFIFDVACNNGTFDGYTCFAEAWLRATSGGQPTGAVAIYASSVSQYWDPPMCAQDEFADLLVAEAYSSLGALYYAASCQMMDEYGAAGADMYKTWHLFGDPSLRVSSFCSDAGTVDLDRATYACSDTAVVAVADCGLNLNDGAYDTVIITVASDSEPAGESVVLTETDPMSGLFSGSIDLSETDGAGVLRVAAGDIVSAVYVDADDGNGGTDVVVSDTADVDCTPPEISNVRAANLQPRSATILFDADEPAAGTVHYGFSCGSLPGTGTSAGFTTAVSVALSGLQDGRTYWYAVEARDEAGNTALDDNAAACYSFTTPQVPDFFTEQFDGDNDVEGLSMLFTPDGSNDFYAACTEPAEGLATDPAGGTVLTMTDDDYEQALVGGGETVSLYGVAYNAFYISSNGYVTFTAGDSDYDETLAEHFGPLPRVSALYDDLTPGTIGQVSWRQLGDRVAVTWLDVPEYNSSVGNTFQIELYFDGRIRVTYTNIAATDGIAGLSQGTGLSPDFWETDLTGLTGCQAVPPLPPPPAHSVPKNRYFSFTPNPANDAVAYQVSLVNSDYFPASSGVVGWVGKPDSKAVARVVPQRVDQVWTQAVVHVGDCEIVPCAEYEVRAIAAGAAEEPGNFSEPLLIETIARPGIAYWADGVGPLEPVCSGDGVTPCLSAADCPGEAPCGVWPGPDGAINFDDIGAAVKAFQCVPGTVWPHFTLVDIHGDDYGDATVDPPNRVVNFADIQFMVLAFQGAPYPFADPLNCP